MLEQYLVRINLCKKAKEVDWLVANGKHELTDEAYDKLVDAAIVKLDMLYNELQQS